MEITGAHLVSILVTVVILAVAAVAATVAALFNSLNSKGEAITNKLAAATAELKAGMDQRTAQLEAGMAQLERAITHVSGDLAAHQKVTNAQMEAIQAAVAAGAEEHKTWHAALDKTNVRLDQLMIQLLERKT